MNFFFVFRTRIEKNLALLQDEESARELGVTNTNLTKCQLIHLCLYLIERECHFTGEGVFLDFPIPENSDDELVDIEEAFKNTIRKYVRVKINK